MLGGSTTQHFAPSGEALASSTLNRPSTRRSINRTASDSRQAILNWRGLTSAETCKNPSAGSPRKSGTTASRVTPQSRFVDRLTRPSACRLNSRIFMAPPKNCPTGTASACSPIIIRSNTHTGRIAKSCAPPPQFSRSATVDVVRGKRPPSSSSATSTGRTVPSKTPPVSSTTIKGASSGSRPSKASWSSRENSFYTKSCRAGATAAP